MKKGDRIRLPYPRRGASGAVATSYYAATVVGFGKHSTVVVVWDEGPLAGREARVPKPPRSNDGATS